MFNINEVNRLFALPQWLFNTSANCKLTQERENSILEMVAYFTDWCSFLANALSRVFLPFYEQI